MLGIVCHAARWEEGLVHDYTIVRADLIDGGELGQALVPTHLVNLVFTEGSGVDAVEGGGLVKADVGIRSCPWPPGRA